MVGGEYVDWLWTCVVLVIVDIIGKVSTATEHICYVGETKSLHWVIIRESGSESQVYSEGGLLMKGMDGNSLNKY